MRLTTVILIASLMQVSAATFGQRVTLNKANASLFSVLKDIRKQTGYGFYYDPATIPQSQKVSIAVSNATIEETLSDVLKGLDLVYKIDGKIVTIKAKEKPSFLERVVATLAEINVSGRVVDADGRGLPGASVSVKGKGGKAVSTGTNGSFYLKGVEEDAVLVVSFIGYVTKEIKAAKELGDVVLELSTSKLDEVQVIAYGTTTQRLSTGNVTTIKADVIEKQPVNNPLLALQGRVPGLFIEQATGFAGTGVKVRIQGQNSIKNGNDPLYVIDGIPFASQLLPGGNNILGNSGINDAKTYGSPLSFINPADIESIDVLKDADATAIYGSRAANGAILITTKTGKIGEIRAIANLQGGFGKVPRRLDLMNAQQYLEMRKETLKNDDILTPTAGPFGDNDLNGNWDNTRNTDWQKELIGGTSHYRDLQTSISGGSINTTFLAGAGYHKEGNVFIGDFDDIKASAHFSLTSASNNQKFRFQISGSYLEDNNTLPNIDLTFFATTLAPVAPNLFNEDKNLNWQPNSGFSTFLANPMAYLFSKSKTKTDNLIGSALLSYEFFNGFDIKSSFGYNKLHSSSINYLTSEAGAPEYRQYFVPTTTFGNNLIDSWSIEPQMSYRRSLMNGKLEVLLGSTIQQQKTDGSIIEASGFSTEQVMEDLKSATRLSATSSVNSIYKYNALFGRINYNLEDKYIINLSARRDGSSRFGSENQFHNFGAIGVAWVFSEERILKNNLDFMSFGKLRASYGTTGSDQIDDYRFLSLYNVISGLTAPYQGVNGYRPYNLTNPYLQWEETRKMQVGLDFGFLKDRILLNINYSRNRSSNQLMQLSLPYMTGFYMIAANLPATVQNSGWEFTLATTNLNSSSFKWATSINLTLPKNKLIEFKDFENFGLKDFYMLGNSLNIQKVYHFSGVNSDNGLFQFQDHNGNPTSAPINADKYVVVNTDPKYYGGFQNSFQYKGFQLDLLFQFTKQISMNYLFGNLQAGQFNNGLGNQPIWQLDRWKNPGDIAKVQKYTDTSTPFIYAQNSDAAWSDASYIRLKNLSLSWQLPSSWKTRTLLQNCKLYLQGQNLLTITNYKGLDPESKSSLSLPPLRVITMGIQIGL